MAFRYQQGSYNTLGLIQCLSCLSYEYPLKVQKSQCLSFEGGVKNMWLITLFLASVRMYTSMYNLNTRDTYFARTYISMYEFQVVDCLWQPPPLRAGDTQLSSRPHRAGGPP